MWFSEAYIMLQYLSTVDTPNKIAEVMTESENNDWIQYLEKKQERSGWYGEKQAAMAIRNSRKEKEHTVKIVGIPKWKKISS